MNSLAVSPVELIAALAAAAVIAMVASRLELLHPSGAVTAMFLGPAIVATGGWWLGAILIGFFLSSALLPDPPGVKPSRTWDQVIANGGPALAFATLGLATSRSPLLLAAAGTIAATTSDTWATEIGRTFGGPPFSVRTGRKVPPGTSGAVSAIGTLASVGGAALIALISGLLSTLAPVDGLIGPSGFLIVAFSGIAGSLIDTLLGATLQASFVCTVCGRVSESASPHRPGHRMRALAGVPWMTNSTVNMLAATFGGVVAALLALIQANGAM